VVATAAETEEVDVIHPLLNHRGLGLVGGTLEEMLAAVEKAARAGKGVYAMKVLGGGHLAGTPAEAAEAFAFVRSLRCVHAVAVGCRTREELLADIALLEGREPPADVAAALAGRPRRLFIESWCDGCGRCVEACRYGALTLGSETDMGDGAKVRVDHDGCILCAYCAAVCPGFHIKVV
jgi:ferredoxin